MKKRKIEFKKLSLTKEVVTNMNADQQFKVAGGGPLTQGCTVSLCNDQCAVTWTCPTQIAQDSICIYCTPTYTQLGQKTC